jgi:hypothetical protein
MDANDIVDHRDFKIRPVPLNELSELFNLGVILSAIKESGVIDEDDVIPDGVFEDRS